MTTTTDISIFFYQILNVDSLTTLLDGGAVYRNQRLEDSSKNDVVIIPRFLKDNPKGVYNGQIQIVAIIKKLAGVPNHKLQLEIEQKIIELLDASTQQQEAKGFYFDFEETTEHDNYDGQRLFTSLYITLNIHKL